MDSRNLPGPFFSLDKPRLFLTLEKGFPVWNHGVLPVFCSLSPPTRTRYLPFFLPIFSPGLPHSLAQRVPAYCYLRIIDSPGRFSPVEHSNFFLIAFTVHVVLAIWTLWILCFVQIDRKYNEDLLFPRHFLAQFTFLFMMNRFPFSNPPPFSCPVSLRLTAVSPVEIWPRLFYFTRLTVL